MYDYLSQRFGHKVGAVGTGIWLATLLLMILLLGGTPETTIRYLAL